MNYLLKFCNNLIKLSVIVSMALILSSHSNTTITTTNHANGKLKSSETSYINGDTVTSIVKIYDKNGELVKSDSTKKVASKCMIKKLMATHNNAMKLHDKALEDHDKALENHYKALELRYKAVELHNKTIEYHNSLNKK